MSENTESRPTRPAPARETLCSNMELVEVLYDLLYQADLGQQDLTDELNALAAEYGDVVFAEILFIISHIRFEGSEAKRHWILMSGHRNSMQRRLCAPVDLRVVLVSYFLEVEPRLKNPKFIELQTFEKTRSCAYNDELTGLCNYRLFKEHLEREIHRVDRYSAPLALVMIDVDDFKNYNDHNGHEAGNEALAMLAQLATASLRKVDVAARYGGEEFALILPSTDLEGARIVAERARLRIAGHAFPYRHHQPGGKLTVSMGIATYPGDAQDASELIRCADRAMYTAKA